MRMILRQESANGSVSLSPFADYSVEGGIAQPSLDLELCAAVCNFIQDILPERAARSRGDNPPCGQSRARVMPRAAAMQTRSPA